MRASHRTFDRGPSLRERRPRELVHRNGCSLVDPNEELRLVPRCVWPPRSEGGRERIATVDLALDLDRVVLAEPGGTEGHRGLRDQDREARSALFQSFDHATL